MCFVNIKFIKIGEGSGVVVDWGLKIWKCCGEVAGWEDFCKL